jgi:hypothetical protein
MTVQPIIQRNIETTTIDSLDFEPQCEHKYHGTNDKRHAGPAAWYQRGTCPKCGEDLDALVCDRWRQTVSTWARTNYMRATCPACLKSFKVNGTDLRFIPL